MTKRADLLALASRVEQLTGPDREVDVEVALAKGWLRHHGAWYTPPNLTIRHHKSELPRYTSSIDAAMTLVPEGEEWCLSKVMYDNKGTPAACVNLMLPEVLAATPALALTAASLRALAEKEA